MSSCPFLIVVARASLHSRQEYQAKDIHQRASIWFEEKKLPAEAVAHGLAAGDFQRTAHLIEQMAETTLWSQGRWASLLKWLEALPETIIYTQPQLCLIYAWALYTTGQWEKVKQFLPHMKQVIKGVTETAARENMLGEIETIRAGIIYEAGDMHQSSIVAQQALALLATDNNLTRAVVFYMLG